MRNEVERKGVRLQLESGGGRDEDGRGKRGKEIDKQETKRCEYGKNKGDRSNESVINKRLRNANMERIKETAIMEA